MKKRTICLVTNWYPTSDNPNLGIFFKEQAFALSEYYNFLVVHYREEIKRSIFRRNSIEKTNQERNTTEYEIKVRVPMILSVINEVYNLYRKRIKKDIVDGIGEFTCKKRSDFTKKKIVKAFHVGIKESIDAFYCIDAQTESFYLETLASEYKRPFIVGEHAPVPWPGHVLSDINKYAIEKANIFLAISNDKIRQMMLLNIKLPPIRYIGNMIDETELKIGNKKHEIKTFIIVAAYSYIKNYDMFISVFNTLTHITTFPFKVMVVGYASNKGYSLNADELEKKIKGSNFYNRAELIPYVPHDQMGLVLNRADAFVMTSIQEGQPVSAMEAACCGLPIFSTRCGGIEDYVDENIGRIYALDDIEGMAAGLKAYIEGSMLFVPEQIREKVIELFGKKAFIQKFTQSFNSVIDVACNE